MSDNLSLYAPLTISDGYQALTARQRLLGHTRAMDVRIRDPLELSLPPITQDWELNCSSDVLKQALAYWTTVRGERSRPTRSDLAPVGMAKYLKHVALIEVRHLSATTRAYRVRVAGTHVENVFGSISGQRIDQALPVAIATRWRQCLDLVVEEGRPLRLTGRAGFENKSWLVGEVLLAPLGDEARPVSMILAVFVWQADADPSATLRDQVVGLADTLKP